jgi:hypothetical protein
VTISGLATDTAAAPGGSLPDVNFTVSDPEASMESSSFQAISWELIFQ